MKKLLKKLFFSIFIASCLQLNAQKIDYKDEALKENSNFYEIVEETRKQFLEKELHFKGEEPRRNKKERKQFERWVWAWKDKVNSDGTFPKSQMASEAYLKLLTNNSNKFAKGLAPKWTQIGPLVTPEVNGYAAYPGMGRINVVAVDTNDTDIMYAGSAAGGLWKTTDEGANWSPKMDNFAGLGVADIIIDPNNSNIIYMATGDGDSNHISSIGLFKSLDAGENWAATGLTFPLSDNQYMRDIAFEPGSSTVIFALTDTAVQKSTDSGNTWAESTGFAFSKAYYQSIIFDPNDATKVIVSDLFGNIYFSSDSGNTFTRHAVVQGNSQNHIVLTSSAADPDNFYALRADGLFSVYKFAMNNDANDLVRETTISGYNSQGGYNQCLAVAPVDKDFIIVGGVNGYKSTNNGVSFSMMLNAYNNPVGVGFYVHPDHHYLSFLADNVTVINGHDGGLHKGSINATNVSEWADLSNGLLITQPYNISITQGINGDDYMMGNQDNDGFSKVYQTDANKWVSCLAGDGTSTGIDIENSAIRYLGGTKGTLYRADNGYADGYNKATRILSGDTNAAFISPLSLHPNVAATIYAGDSDVKKSINKGGTGQAGDWAALNSGLTETEFLDVSLMDVNDNASVRIFAIGKSGDNSTLKGSFNDGATWATVASPADVTINSIYGVPNTDVVYATVSGYTSGKKVYKSSDSGDNWSDISGDLPNIIAYKIILDPNQGNETLYLATELGLYFTNNSTTNWEKLGTGLPNVRVSDIEISKNNGNVYIGTFGRGLWVYNSQKYFDNVTDAKWSETDNWEGESLPTATDDVFIAANSSLDTDDVTIKSLEIGDNLILSIDKTSDLTIESYSSGFVTIDSDADNAGVLIVKGTSTGALQYTRGGMFANEWSLISAPLQGQTISSFISDTPNDIREVDDAGTTKYAIGYYDDSKAVGSKWVYYDENINANTTFESTKSYALSKNGTGSVRFIGNLATDNQTATVVGGAWNAIGNPFTAYYPANLHSGSFLNENESSLAEQAVYLWDEDQNKYVAFSDLAPSEQKGLQPGQGFFIKTKAGATSVLFAKDERLTKPAAGNNGFYKSEAETPFIQLLVKNGNIEVKTTIIYDDNATLGLDSKYDILNFDSSNFDVTSQLLEGDLSENYTIQSIPKNDFENQIIPINLKVAANKEVIFSLKSTNLPNDLHVYLEDKETNMFHKLSNGGSYKITTTKEVNSIGRFYMHASRSSLSTINTELDQVSIFNFNKELFINGLDEGVLNIKLFDVSGKQIVSQNQKAKGKNSLQLNKLSSGIYLVKVSFAKSTITKKIVLN